MWLRLKIIACVSFVVVSLAERDGHSDDGIDVANRNGTLPMTSITMDTNIAPSNEETAEAVVVDGNVDPTMTKMSGNSNNEDKEEDEGIPFLHFVAHNSTMTCTADEHAQPFNTQVRGVNLGGWMVLEPWITPSLFYQFLGKGENTTAFDMYTFCEVLGPEEANRQLQRHWKTWVTEEIVQQLADSAAVNSLRLPIGDFQFVEYGPYKGCVDGGLDYVDQLLDWAYQRGLSVLLDIHAMKDSQNGFDNSGQAMGFRWTSALSSEFAGYTTFEHWPIRTANWIGSFDPNTASYTDINYANIEHGLEVIRRVVDRYYRHPAVLGIEPVNEPWQYTPLDILKRFYWEGYLIVKRKAPDWKYVIHDSFRLEAWSGFMDGCPERALDTHIYQAWKDPDSIAGFYTDACAQKDRIAQMERNFGPVIVGEWSLATDNCAMWLNGFNDNLPGFPRLPCKYTPCSDPYMGTDQPGTPVDPALPLQGPYGSGMSGPIFGLCPGSRDWLKEKSGKPLSGQDWIRLPPNAPKLMDDTDEVMTRLAMKKIQAFSGFGHGFFFWNFRTDLYEPQWSYMAALERGWIPQGSLNDPRIDNACRREDNKEYHCVLKKNQLEKNIRNALVGIFQVQNTTETPEAKAILNLTGSALESAAQIAIANFFESNRLNGATCDFGGIAMLSADQNVTFSDNESEYDDFFYTEVVKTGPPLWLLLSYGLIIALVAGFLGFVVAMRTNPSFNRRVRSNPLFMPIARSSNSLLRSSLALPELGPEYEELKLHNRHQYGPVSF